MAAGLHNDASEIRKLSADGIMANKMASEADTTMAINSQIQHTYYPNKLI
jgi:hypothetical protein